jgi:hypothetical protein
MSRKIAVVEPIVKTELVNGVLDAIAPKAEVVSVEPKAEVLPKIENHNDILDLMKGKKMDARLAQLAFAFAQTAAQFMRTGAQASVNKDFKAEIPNALAGLDVNGEDIKLSVSTRQMYEKLDKGLLRAVEFAQAEAQAIAQTTKEITTK